MNKAVRRKLEMVARVREFSRAHPSDDPGYAVVLGRLEERLARAEAIATRQVKGTAEARAAQTRRRELRRVVESQLLRHLVAVGSVAGKSHGELAERYKLPYSKAPNQAFLTYVKELVTLAQSQRELLVKEGLGETLLEDLGKLVSEFEALSEAARTGRRDHIGARAELEVIASGLLDQVRVLDGVNRDRFGKDKELLAEWRAVREVPGLPRQKGPSRPSGTGEVTPGPGDIAPAA
jgi:hypothetical protein